MKTDTEKTTSAAFKEWKLICDLLGQGKQSIILRKGGIAEGREGFQFKHPDFFLFPTFFHEQAEKVRLDEEPSMESMELEGSADAARDEISISLFAHTDFHKILTEYQQVVRLKPFHFWDEAEVRKRFDWEEKPVQVKMNEEVLDRIRDRWEELGLD